MIINNDEASKRLNSPMNLINKLRSSNRNGKNNAMSLFGMNKKSEIKQDKQEIKITFNPFESKKDTSIRSEQSQPLAIIPSSTSQISQQVPAKQEETLDNILENHDSQIRLGLAHDKALELLNKSVEMLSTKLDDVKADKLPAVISAASKTVESIRKERNEATKNNKDREVHYHFYTPQQQKISDYEVIDVGAR